MAKSVDAIKIVESKLVSFGSYSNIRSILAKYTIPGGRDDEINERIMAIFIAEFRHELETMRNKLPEDEVEAEAKLARKGRRGRPRKNAGLEIETVDEMPDGDDE